MIPAIAHWVSGNGSFSSNKHRFFFRPAYKWNPKSKLRLSKILSCNKLINTWFWKKAIHTSKPTRVLYRFRITMAAIRSNNPGPQNLLSLFYSFSVLILDVLRFLFFIKVYRKLILRFFYENLLPGFYAVALVTHSHHAIHAHKFWYLCLKWNPWLGRRYGPTLSFSQDSLHVSDSMMRYILWGNWNSIRPRKYEMYWHGFMREPRIGDHSGRYFFQHWSSSPLFFR